MAGGFTGKYLVVNLTDGTSETVEPGENIYKKYLSGYGLGAAVITERQKPGIDPLSPESYLGFCSGLLTGTGAYFTGRFMVVGKSPLTGGWGDANSGGHFSNVMKQTGYDAIFFTGAAKNPVWVYVTDNGVEIKDAGGLWGKDTTETEEQIKSELGDKKVQIASIGMSGEKMSLISGIVTDAGRIAARSGLGAVMGSKKLKALVVKGSKKPAVARADELKAMNKKFLAEFKKSPAADRLTVKMINSLSVIIGKTGISVPTKPSTVREIFRTYGTSGLTVFSAQAGDSPIKNWKGVGLRDFPLKMAEKLSDESVKAYQKRKYACQSCPLGCGGVISFTDGRYSGTDGHKPEYETLCSFGGLSLNDDLDTVLEINELCNRAGIDTISAGGAVAFAIECFEQGIISAKDTGGLELGWGKSEEILKLTEMIISREGFGDLLADGVKKAAQKIGSGSDQYAIHAGGQELPMHDSRFDTGMALAYQCEPTPGRHTITSNNYINLFGVKKFPLTRKLLKGAKGKDVKNVRLLTVVSLYMQVLNGCGVCEFGPMTSVYPLFDYINMVTGWDLSVDDYLKIGERILSLRKAFNVREGLKAEDSKLHDRAAGIPPLKAGPLKNVTLDMDLYQSEFFSILGWDMTTGGPTQEKAGELGLVSWSGKN